MSSNLMNSAVSGLNAANAAITVTSNNISNVNTPGYSRQSIVQSASFSSNLGYGYLGNGVSVDTVKRAYNQFLTEQSNSARTQNAFFSTYSGRMDNLINTLGDSSTSVNVSINNFYSAIQDFSARPSESATGVLTSANAMAARIRTVSEQMQQTRNGTNTDITANLTQLNQLSLNVADLNSRIVAAASANPNQLPNDLLDQRDQLVRSMNDIVGVSVTMQDNQQMNIFMSNGQPLVIGDIASEFKTITDGADANGMRVVLSTPGNDLVLRESDITGGSVGALLSFRNNELSSAQNELGKLSISLTAAYNQQQQFGIDSKGNPGAPLFTVGPPLVIGAVTNKPDQVSILTQVNDSRNLQPSNYSMTFDGTAYQVTRLSDGELVNTQTATIPGTNELEFDGLKITVNATDFPVGNKYTIDTLSQAAAGFNVIMTDPKQLAPASALQLVSNPANTGTGQVSALRPSANASGFDYTSTIQIKFTDDAGSYQLLDAANAPLTPPVTGVINTITGGTISLNGWSVDIKGTPKSGDTFAIVNKPGDPAGDNTNALALAKLSSSPIANGKTLTGSYADFVSTIGNRAQEIKVGAAAADLTFSQATISELANSGVNLDEEGANLIRFQQAYAAASKVLTTSSTLFDTLLAAIR